MSSPLPPPAPLAFLELSGGTFVIPVFKITCEHGLLMFHGSTYVHSGSRMEIDSRTVTVIGSDGSIVHFTTPDRGTVQVVEHGDAFQFTLRALYVNDAPPRWPIGRQR